MIRDFIGNVISVGDYLAFPGRGNATGEYGMLMGRVIEAGDKLKVIRIEIGYPDYKIDTCVAKSRKMTIRNHNKCVVIHPTPEAIRAFEEGASGECSRETAILLSCWIHGAEHQRPWDE